MKLSLVLVLTIATTLALTRHHQDDLKWQQFKYAHQKVYKTPEEEQKRYELLLQRFEQVNEHNEKYEQGLTSYRKGINQFSDWTPEELAIYFDVNEEEEIITNHEIFHAERRAAVPDNVDWRDKGAVTPVKNQGGRFICKSGWSFSVTGALEGIMQIEQNRAIPLSEQNLIDCSVPKGGNGCKGNSRTAAFQYVVKDGIEKESDYNYTQSAGECKFDIYKSVLSIQSYKRVPIGDENALKRGVAMQPISIILKAGDDFIQYDSGIFESNDCSTPKFHLPLLVIGYGSENGTDFWIIKNSWGVEWGEQGYMRMIRNRENQCGVASSGLFPFNSRFDRFKK